MSLLSPRRAGAPPLAITERSGRRVLRAEIDGGDVIDTLIAAPDMGRIDFPDVRGYAELALIRRARDGRLLDCWTAGGEPLEIAGDARPAERNTDV